MVKAKAEACVDIGGSDGGGYLFTHSLKQEVTFDLQVHKKFKTQSLRKWISSAVKGRRQKDKDSPSPLTPPNSQDEGKLYLEADHVKEQLCDADFVTLVDLPHGLDEREWLATHTISFFEHISLMYDTVAEYCTSSGCASMTGPANSSYVWEDSRGKKCKCTAPQYVDYVMTYSQSCVRSEAVFPTKYGNVFPPTFESTVKKIHRLLFHVIAHIYHSHYKEILVFRLHPHLNTLLLHFLAFSRRFSLLEDYKETDALDDLYGKLVCEVLARRHPDKMSSPEANGSARSREGSGDVGMGKDCKSRGGTPSPSKESNILPPPPSSQELEENKENLMQSHSASPSPTPPPPDLPQAVTS